MSETWWVAPSWSASLAARGLTDFATAWSHCRQPADEVNRRNRGWAAVHRVDLQDGAPGQCPAIYLKQQQDYLTRSVLRPLGEPVAARELRNLHGFAKMGLPVPQVVCYGVSQGGRGLATLLGTAALHEYQALDEALAAAEGDAALRSAVITGAGALIGRLHHLRWEYRCLYPKHVYVRLASGQPPQFAFIDLEKARRRVRARYGALRDLTTFMNRCVCWQPEDWTNFYRGYFAQDYSDARRDAMLEKVRARRARRG